MICTVHVERPWTPPRVTFSMVAARLYSRPLSGAVVRRYRYRYHTSPSTHQAPRDPLNSEDQNSRLTITLPFFSKERTSQEHNRPLQNNATKPRKSSRASLHCIAPSQGCTTLISTDGRVSTEARWISSSQLKGFVLIMELEMQPIVFFPFPPFHFFF